MRVVVAIIVLTVLCACSAGRDYHRSAAPAAPNPDGTVSLKALSFSPATTTIKAGQRVAWRWDKPAVTHDVAFDDGVASPKQDQGSWERTFTEPGTYPYKCTLHPQMTGKVVVEP